MQNQHQNNVDDHEDKRVLHCLDQDLDDFSCLELKFDPCQERARNQSSFNIILPDL